ncbi:hypothetical protein BV20DRAFT_956564, partial [Pilatotrama ljubarskyi]
DPGNVLYLLRSAAHSVSYMNVQAIRTEFLRIARLVENEWVDYFALYNAAAGTQYDVRSAYRTWLRVLGYGVNANAFFKVAVQVLRDELSSAPGNSIKVGVPKNCNRPKVDFSLTDLNNLANSLPTGGISWSYP